MDELDFVLQAERDLLTSAKRSSRTYLNSVLADGFIEIGQSGILYDKQTIIATLAASPNTYAQLANLRAERLAKNTILLHYETTNISVSRKPIKRHSLWQMTGNKWQLLYHEAEQ